MSEAGSWSWGAWCVRLLARQDAYLAFAFVSTGVVTIYEPKNDTSRVNTDPGCRRGISRCLGSGIGQLPLRGANAEGKAFSLANSDSTVYHNAFSVRNPLFLPKQQHSAATAAAGRENSTTIWGTGWDQPRKLGAPLRFQPLWRLSTRRALLFALWSEALHR